ncbi:CsbD family protein, partial [Streptomyces sp. NPDC056728]
MDKVKGKAKEMTGKVTGDRRKEASGRADQAKGEAK